MKTKIHKALAPAKNKIRNFIESLYRVVRSWTFIIPYWFNVNPNSSFREVTEFYPDPFSSKTPEDLPSRYRGLVKCRIDLCIGCYDCAKVCPTSCIEIVSEKVARTNKEWIKQFDIQHLSCIQCGRCVEVCPTQALVHSTEFRLVAAKKEELTESFGKGELVKEIPRW